MGMLLDGAGRPAGRVIASAAATARDLNLAWTFETHDLKT
jgi:hypothetical protein